MAHFARLLITGAAGSLGSVLRTGMHRLADTLRLSDLAPVADAREHEEVVTCDLADREAVLAMTHGVDAVLHFGGIAQEAPFGDLLQANYVGLHNLYEGCRKNGVRRVVWGSSNHAVGFHPRTQRLDASAVPRPDSNYGVSKVFGEAMAQYYWDKFAIETVSIRIGSCAEKPTSRRMLSTWLSYRDFTHLCACCLKAPRVEHTIVYGVSANDSLLWDNRLAAHLGYRPKDNAEEFRPDIEAGTALPDPQDPKVALQGGSFAAAGSADD